MAQSIGIDFGTAYLTAALWTADGPRTLARMPAVARMLHGGGALCGEEAHAARSAYALSTIDRIKRFLGRTREEVRDAARQVAWNLEPDPAAPEGFQVDAWTGRFAPEAVAAELLRELARRAREALGQDLRGAVLTIPAAATNRQRLALKHAASLAGLSVLRIVNEPAALAIAEAHAEPVAWGEQRWAVLSFGAGMTDAAVVRVGRDGVAVEAAAGDTGLGLGEIREKLIAKLETLFSRRHGVPVDRTRPEVRAELTWLGEELLQALCEKRSHRVDLKGAACGRDGAPLDLNEVLTRHDLKLAARAPARRLLELADRALRQAGCPKGRIHRVILAGGGAFVPALREAVQDFFRKAPAQRKGRAPHERPAHGAALLAASLDGRVDLRLQDVLARSLGIALVHDRFSVVLPAGQPLPARQARCYTTVEDNQRFIKFEVREGEEPAASRNALLGQFHLAGLRLAPAGVPNVEVAFRIDESGILDVEAVDVDTRARQRVQIERARSA
ncbi:MAG: heat shock 70 family protein [Planctomycetota bacterium]|nr:heat shock 70 family protein [Planctomycetota bacterium]